jgi:hypothetical protein
LILPLLKLIKLLRKKRQGDEPGAFFLGFAKPMFIPFISSIQVWIRYLPTSD